MNKAITKLQEYVDGTMVETSHYLSVALSSFFEEFLDFNSENSFESITSLLGEEVFEIVYPCAYEFFITGEYQNVDGSNKSWNIIDQFLEARAKSLSKNEISYLTSLKNSYMSVYEVVDVVPDKSLTVRDIIQELPAVTIQEKLATRGLSKGNYVGLRMANEGDKAVMAGGALLLKDDYVEDLVTELQDISSMMLASFTKRRREKLGLSMEQIELMQKQLWAKEIAAAWIDAELKEQQSSPIIQNVDGEALQICTVRFPVLGSKKKIRKIIGDLPDVELVEPEDTKSPWIWHSNQSKSGVQRNSAGNSVFAFIEIEGKSLILDVNSYERATVAAGIIKEKLGTLVGRSLVGIESLDVASDDEFDGNGDIPPEIQAEIMHNLKDKHYREWVDIALPVLNGKTPRQAAKTKKGQSQVRALIENIHLHEVKNSKNSDVGEIAYDVSWMFEELGLNKSA